MVENCDNCAFGVNGTRGLECHKRAPIVLEGITHYRSEPTGGEGSICFMREIRGAVTAWPCVRPDYFCGDFELKDAG